MPENCGVRPGGGRADAGCGPEKTVAAAYVGADGAGRIECPAESGGGIAAGPIPGPIALASCLKKISLMLNACY